MLGAREQRPGWAWPWGRLCVLLLGPPDSCRPPQGRQTFEMGPTWLGCPVVICPGAHPTCSHSQAPGWPSPRPPPPTGFQPPPTRPLAQPCAPISLPRVFLWVLAPLWGPGPDEGVLSAEDPCCADQQVLQATSCPQGLVIVWPPPPSSQPSLLAPVEFLMALGLSCPGLLQDSARAAPPAGSLPGPAQGFQSSVGCCLWMSCSTWSPGVAPPGPEPS